MTARARHAFVVALAAGVLSGLWLTRPALHAPLGLAMLVAAFAIDAPVARGLGSPRRWLVVAIVLAMIGLWLGPRGATVAGVPVSHVGAMAATTMVTRAMALVLAGAGMSALWPPAQALARLRGKRFGRFAEVLVVALELVPSLVVALRGARDDAKKRTPRWHDAPARAFETFVFAVMCASALAETAARDLARPSPKSP